VRPAVGEGEADHDVDLEAAEPVDADLLPDQDLAVDAVHPLHRVPDRVGPRALDLWHDGPCGGRRDAAVVEHQDLQRRGQDETAYEAPSLALGVAHVGAEDELAGLELAGGAQHGPAPARAPAVVERDVPVLEPGRRLDRGAEQRGGRLVGLLRLHPREARRPVGPVAEHGERRVAMDGEGRRPTEDGQIILVEERDNRDHLASPSTSERDESPDGDTPEAMAMGRSDPWRRISHGMARRSVIAHGAPAQDVVR
jgi:hypothetical protein